MFSTCRLLSALFRLGSRLYCLSRRFQSVCCTLSFVSNHRNLLIAVSVASYYVISERWFFRLLTLHRSVKAHGNENLAFKVCLPKILNRLSEYTLYFLECCTFMVSMIFFIKIHACLSKLWTASPHLFMTCLTRRYLADKSLKFKFLLIRVWMMSFRVTEPKAVIATRRAN